MALRRQRRVRTFQERKNVFEMFDDFQLIKRYRLDRAGIIFVTDLVRDVISPSTTRSNAIPAELKVVLMLRFLATGKMQQCSADDLGPSQPTISRVVMQTIMALTARHIVTRFIDFPTTPRVIQQKQTQFMQIAGFPGVVGAIDGTHIKIIAPSINEDVYVNRKRYHSINTQVVFDAEYNILDVVPKWPGSTHDARIFTESGLNKLFETGLVPPGCPLLGDKGYPLRRWLLTPFSRAVTEAQINYNRAHRSTRSVVERGIGQWKRRFHILHSEIRYSPEKVCRIIMACEILHNICKKRNIPSPPTLENRDDGDEDGDESTPASTLPVCHSGVSPLPDLLQTPTLPPASHDLRCLEARSKTEEQMENLCSSQQGP
ncbi:putative nuclease HARBI1 [Trichomycterus rosablanca]|uniref:putative nuclease HARBI1 n=1 Tax=Trichomycterus rosablanca TaxID=2290929 RepID=UPI002F36094E